MSKNRKDGIRVNKIDSMHAIMPHLMPNRCDAEVSIIEKIDITELVKYIEELNKKIEYKTTIFHAIITALGKTIYNRPLLNRFIAGKKYYDRKEISFSFVAKDKFEDHAEERLIILHTKDNMNINNISKYLFDKIKSTRKQGTNEMNDTLSFVTKWPVCIVSFIMWCFRKLDFHGKVPKSISDTDPNYTTVLISNLGSIKANACYHHLNNYGTNSIMITVGEIHKENITDEKGKIKTRDFVNIGFTIDERIADGFYFAKSIKLFKYILENPIILEDEISKDVVYEKEERN